MCSGFLTVKKYGVIGMCYFFQRAQVNNSDISIGSANSLTLSMQCFSSHSNISCPLGTPPVGEGGGT